MRFSTILVVIGLLSGSVSLARGQSLADAAKQEAERRKTVPTGKVFTNKDLKPVPESAPAPDPDAPAASADSSDGSAAKPAEAADGTAPVAAKPQGGGDQRGEAYWRARMTSLRQNLERNETLLDALESRINGLNQDFVNRDDPAQRAAIAADREKARAEQERVRKAVADGPVEIAAAEEEARQLGVPPGWLR